MILFDKRVPLLAKLLIVWCAAWSLVNAYFAVTHHSLVGVVAMIAFAGLFLWYLNLAYAYRRHPLPQKATKE